MGTIVVTNAGSIDEVPTFTWNNKPTAAVFGEGQAFFSDVGPNGSIVYSDGTTFVKPTDAGVLVDRIYNANPANLRKIAAAISATLASVSNTVIAFVGDSVDRGSVIGTWANTQRSAAPTLLASLLNSHFAPSTSDSIFGDGGMGNANFDAADARCSRQQFSAAGTPRTVGGAYWYTSTPGTNGFQFTPTGSCDTYEIFLNQFASSANDGVLTFLIDGIAPTTGPATYNLNQNPSQTTKVTIGAASAGVHLIEVRSPTTGKQAFLIGIRGSLSTQKRILIDNLGWGGSKTSDWLYSTTYGGDPLEALPVLAPNLTFINLTINDVFAGITAESWSANMQTIITAAKLTGDVVLCMGNPTYTAETAHAGLEDQYWGAMKVLADLNGCVAIDSRYKWNGYAQAIVDGYLDATEKLHPTKAGHANLAMTKFKLIKSLI